MFVSKLLRDVDTASFNASLERRRKMISKLTKVESSVGRVVMKCNLCGMVHRLPEQSCADQVSQNLSWSKVVTYAFALVLDSAKLTLHDRLILHALGVAWI